MCCNDSASGSQLGRKKELRRVEGTRPRRTWHRIKNPRFECISRRHAVLHSAFIFFVRDHLRTVAAPSTSGSPCSPGRPCVKHWWKGAATLQIRALHAIGTSSKHPASQAFKPAPYSPPVHVLTVCSAPVNRVQSESVCGPTFSMSIGLQRLSSMNLCGLGMT